MRPSLKINPLFQFRSCKLTFCRDMFHSLHEKKSCYFNAFCSGSKVKNIFVTVWEVSAKCLIRIWCARLKMSYGFPHLRLNWHFIYWILESKDFLKLIVLLHNVNRRLTHTHTTSFNINVSCHEHDEPCWIISAFSKWDEYWIWCGN